MASLRLKPWTRSEQKVNKLAMATVYSEKEKCPFYKILFIQTYFFLNHFYLGMTWISDSRRARRAAGSGDVRLCINVQGLGE